jgi:hypothetical protein
VELSSNDDSTIEIGLPNCPQTVVPTLSAVRNNLLDCRKNTDLLKLASNMGTLIMHQKNVASSTSDPDMKMCRDLLVSEAILTGFVAAYSRETSQVVRRLVLPKVVHHAGLSMGLRESGTLQMALANEPPRSTPEFNRSTAQSD